MKRWVNTLVLYDAAGRVVTREGYWYDGPLSLAVAMATFDLSDYAFYDDDANESTATQIGSTNNQTTLNVDVDLQARVNITENGGASGTFNQISWMYDHNGGGDTNISTSSSVIRAVATANNVNDEDASDRIGSGGTYITANAGVTEDGNSSSVSYNTSERANFVLVFQIIGADVSDGDEMRLTIQGVDSTSNDPDIDVNKPTSARRIFMVT